MAIPLIISGALAVTGVVTAAYKGNKAVSDHRKASNVNNEAKSIIEESEIKLDKSTVQCERKLKALGELKIKTIEENIQQFIILFKLIKDIEYKDSHYLDNLDKNEFSYELLNTLNSNISFIKEAGIGILSGATSGALVAFGAYGGTMTLATASTGTAISSLGGAAATNATLAWLGGGSLASGGLGMAGGSLVLGSLVAAPALIISSWYIGEKAEEKLNNAYTNKSQAEKFRSDVNKSIAILDGIRSVAITSYDILNNLKRYSDNSLRQFKELIQGKGINYNEYDDEGKRIVLKNYKLIQLIQVLLSTPILDQEGNLVGDVSKNLSKLQVDVAKVIN